MKIRDYKIVQTDSCIITVKKDKCAYKSTYSISVFSTSSFTHSTFPNRAKAKEELIRLLKLHTNMNITEINKL